MSVGVRTLTGPEGDRYEFDPGCLSLELLLTGGPGKFRRYEILAGPADLAAWLADSRLAEAAPLTADDFRIHPAELRAIKEFRDALYSVVPGLARGERPAPADLELVNQCVGEPPRPRIDPATGRRGWVTPISGTQVLGAAAREAVDLICGDLVSRVRECAADDCHLMFLDTSRPGNRRWCSMRRCGNRNKVREYRSRRGGE